MSGDRNTLSMAAERQDPGAEANLDQVRVQLEAVKFSADPEDYLSHIDDPDVDSSEEYFDAEDEQHLHHTSPSTGAHAMAVAMPSPSISITTIEGDPPDVEEDSFDPADDDMAGVIASNRSVILQILSQIRIGMDLTRFVLPVFLLESRSLLEMFGEFFAHPHIITGVTDIASPKDRMIEIVRWYISSFSSSRKGVAPKKPYNPVLGETFQCYWDLPNGKRSPPNPLGKVLLDSGPVPYAGYDSLAFVAEQVSHHPPISSFYCECPSKNMFVSGTIGTKTKFLGLSVKAQNSGSVCLTYLDYGEEYIGTIPNGYARSVLTVPWFEFGGESTLDCAQSGYHAKIEFHTKPFRGGKKHRVTGEIKHKSEKSPCYKIEGEWNGIMYGKHQSGRQEVFFDCSKNTKIKKKLKKLSAAEPGDSRIVWRRVSEAIRKNDAEGASSGKHEVEEKQRAEAKERQKTGDEFQHKFFHNRGDPMSWQYNKTLSERRAHFKSVH